MYPGTVAGMVCNAFQWHAVASVPRGFHPIFFLPEVRPRHSFFLLLYMVTLATIGVQSVN